MEIADNNEVHPIGIDFYPREKANQTHSQSYVEDLQALSGQKRYAKMARLNLSVLPEVFPSFNTPRSLRSRSAFDECRILGALRRRNLQDVHRPFEREVQAFHHTADG